MPPVYRGPFGKPQAERLLWRAGFGPRPGEAEALAKLGLRGAVHALTNPGRERFHGPRPHDDNGHRLAPNDAWGHDQLWWLDRMVRTTQPLAERMTLVWHDWFATSEDGVGPARLMLRQNRLFRQHALGSFSTLLTEVTRDPAMLLWLSGTDNEKDDPNENYGREMMELFTIGADRGGYTEQDVREQARALTGWRNDWDDNLGPVNFRFDKRRHDNGVKKIFGKKGIFDWTWLMSLAGQQLFFPPNVAGWDDSRWLDTATYRARWLIASQAIEKRALKPDKTKLPDDASKLLVRAEAFFGRPVLTGQTHSELKRFAKSALGDANAKWKKEQYPALIENALRQLLASSPDLQTC